MVKQKGLLNMTGWLKRESEVRGEKRWKRTVVRGVVRENGGAELVRNEEGLPLPKQFRLGLEKRGVELNHSSRARNNFGLNRTGLTGGSGSGVREKSNWISTFTRVGCLGCKEGGEGTHRGRTGDPVLLVVGDEATPLAVGYTKKGGVDSCAWILKKEHWPWKRLRVC